MAQIESKSELKKLFILYARIYIHESFICSVSSKKKEKKRNWARPNASFQKSSYAILANFFSLARFLVHFLCVRLHSFFFHFLRSKSFSYVKWSLPFEANKTKLIFWKRKKKTEFLGRFSFFSVAILKIEFLAYFFGTVAFFLFLRVGFF